MVDQTKKKKKSNLACEFHGSALPLFYVLCSLKKVAQLPWVPLWKHCPLLRCHLSFLPTARTPSQMKTLLLCGLGCPDRTS